MKSTYLAALVFITLLSGCKTVIIDPGRPDDLRSIKHMINIDRDGNFIPIGAGKHDRRGGEKIFELQQKMAIKTGDYESAVVNDFVMNAFLKGIEDEIKQSGKKDILLFIHGGLNTDKKTISRVIKLYQSVLDSGKYPIFINWRSGPISTYSSHLMRVREGRVSSTAPFTSPIYLATDLANAIINAPKAWSVQGRHLYKATLGLPDRRLAFFNSQNDVQLIGGGQKPKLQKAASMAAWALASPVKVFTTPFTNTMGKPAWDIMLRRVKTQFRKPAEFRIDQSPYCLDQEIRKLRAAAGDNDQSSCSPGTGALSVFLDWLIKQQQENGYHVTAIGHSMGTIVLNEMLMARPEFEVDEIVYMGAAVKTRDAIVGISPYLQKNPGARFYNLMLHPGNEDREKNISRHTTEWQSTSMD
ncbi:MAG: hypothetical protein ACI9J2_002694 [Saprospiraceae bacterium]|jgi:hypothetical protein